MMLEELSKIIVKGFLSGYLDNSLARKQYNQDYDDNEYLLLEAYM